MLTFTLLLSLAALSTQAPLDPASSGELTEAINTLAPNTTLPGFNLTNPAVVVNPDADFECYQDRPSFRLDDCLLDVGDGLSLAEYEKPRVWGSWPGGLRTPQYWVGLPPHTGYCKLRLTASETTPRGPKPAKFSYADIDNLERTIVRRCQYRMGGHVHTAGGHARVYMNDPQYGSIRTVFDVALYATGKVGQVGSENAMPQNTTTPVVDDNVASA